MSEYILNTKQLTKKFKNSIVLNHINLEIPKGKVYGLLGINGCQGQFKNVGFRQKEM